MKNYILKICFLLFFGFNLQINAQDLHFSQFISAPLNINPANTGLTDCKNRFVLNQRNQWQSVTTPFRTLSASFDSKITLNSSNLGIGIILNSDKAGDSEFGTTNIGIRAAFHRYLNSDSTLFFSFGLGTNYNQKSINYDNLYFGIQYFGDQYDENREHGEIFSNNKINYIDINLGFQLQYKLKNGTPINWGISYSHANNTKQSFNSNDEIILDRHLITTISSDFKMNENLNFQPSVLIMGQGKYREYMIGGIFKNRIQGNSIDNIYWGMWYRYKDALIPSIFIDYRKIILGISYDINISDLRVASGMKGGLELSLVYNICKKKQILMPLMKQCPVYM